MDRRVVREREREREKTRFGYDKSGLGKLEKDTHTLPPTSSRYESGIRAYIKSRAGISLNNIICPQTFIQQTHQILQSADPYKQATANGKGEALALRIATATNIYKIFL